MCLCGVFYPKSGVFLGFWVVFWVGVFGPWGGVLGPWCSGHTVLKCHPAFIISHLIISKETPAPIEMKLHFFSSEIRKQRWNPSRQSCLDLGVVSQAWRHFFKKKIATEKTNFSSSSNFLWEQNQLYINGCFLHTKLWYGWYGFISFIQWVIHHR